MKREFCCVSCGLYFWEEGGLTYSYCCPDCGDENMVFAVDTHAFAHYFGHAKNLKDRYWSSKRYAPEFAIDHYKKQGIVIR